VGRLQRERAAGLRKQIQSSRGQNQARFADRAVTWSSETERRQLVAEITGALDRLAGRRRARRYRIAVRKGFE
jgi:hypothetical protein